MTALGAGDPEIDEALRRFTNAEPMFARWQETLAKGPATSVEP
jgi:hypothetical protein